MDDDEYECECVDVPCDECDDDTCPCMNHVEPCMICGYKECICDDLYERAKERRLGLD